jgi:hypothetical protein
MWRLVLRLRQADIYNVLAIWLFLALAKCGTQRRKGSFANFGQAIGLCDLQMCLLWGGFIKLRI